MTQSWERPPCVNCDTLEKRNDRLSTAVAKLRRTLIDAVGTCEWSTGGWKTDTPDETQKIMRQKIDEYLSVLGDHALWP